MGIRTQNFYFVVMHLKTWEDLFVGPVGSLICEVLPLVYVSRLYSCSKAMRSSYNLKFAIQNKKTKYHEEYTEKYQCRVIQCHSLVYFSTNLAETITVLDLYVHHIKVPMDISEYCNRMVNLIYFDLQGRFTVDNPIVHSKLKDLRLHLYGGVTLNLGCLPKSLRMLLIYNRWDNGRGMDCVYEPFDGCGIDDLVHLGIVDVTKLNLPKMKNLRNICLLMPKMVLVYHILEHCEKLMDLTITPTKSFDWKRLKYTQLKYLVIYGYSSRSIVVHLDCFPETIKKLALSRVKLNTRDRQVDMNTYESQRDYPNLTEIKLTKVKRDYDGGGFNQLLFSRCPNLTKLTLEYFKDFDLIQCPNVTELILKACRPKNLAFLSNFPRLKRFTCPGYKPTQEEIAFWSPRITISFHDD